MEPFVFDLTGEALAKLQVKSQPKHGQAVVLTNSLTTKPGVIKYSYAATGDGVDKLALDKLALDKLALVS